MSCNSQMTYSSAQAARALFAVADPPTALFVTNNQMTLGALQAFKDLALRCPEDVSLISFDDHDWAPFFSPPLTVVSQPTYQLGCTAAELLLKLIQGETISRPASLPVEFIIRESCRKLSA